MGNVNMEATQIHDRTEAGKHQSVAEHLKALDALAQQIEDMPAYTSSDRAWLDEWEEKLPADPETDGVKVLTATTESGETVLSWEEPTSGIKDLSTTEQLTGRKWLNSPTYQIVIDLGEEKSVQSNAWYTVGDHLSADVIINGIGVSGGGGTIPLQIVEDTTDGIKILQTRNVQVGVRYLWLEYTKTTV